MGNTKASYEKRIRKGGKSKIKFDEVRLAQ